MKYFKNADGIVFAYAADGSQDHIIPPTQPAITEFEADDLRNPKPTSDQIISALTSAVQSHLETTAQTLGYDDLKTAVGYADEPAVVKFQEEGKALRAWRSLVWASCIATMQLVEEGQVPVPTAAALIASLPAFSL